MRASIQMKLNFSKKAIGGECVTVKIKNKKLPEGSQKFAES